MSKQLLAVFAALAMASFPVDAGEELMPMMPSTWTRPDAAHHSPRPELQRISSDNPQSRRANEQTPPRNMQKNTVKLKLPSLGTAKAASQYRVVELEEMAPGGIIDFEAAKSVPTRPQDIPGLLPETLTIDRYNQAVAAPRDEDLRDLVSFGEEPGWIYGAGYGWLEPLSQPQPSLRRMPQPAQLELPPPLTPSAMPETRLDSTFLSDLPADRVPDTTVRLTAAPKTAVRVDESIEAPPPPAKPVAITPEAKSTNTAESLRPPDAADASLASLKPPPGFTTPTIADPPPAVEKPIPMPETVIPKGFHPAPPMTIVQDNAVDVGQMENVDGFVPVRALKVF